MSTSLRASKFRLIGGTILAVAGLVTATFMLPDASQKRLQTEKALKEASSSFDRQVKDLKNAQAEAARIKADRQALDELTQNMSAEGVGILHWKLSEKLYELSKKHGVRLIAVKYGPAAREGSKGSLLESVDVEFNATGIYLNLKSFMLALEGSKLPFAVVNAKLDEAPEGGHLTITLRAFRQPSATPAETHDGEGA
jgi:gas vesicle protein